MVNIEKIFKQFDLLRNDTFFFTINGNHEADIRIFRKDGMEVEYKRQYPTPNINPDHWFMNDTQEESKSGNFYFYIHYDYLYLV